jgi:hypothetical protein
VEPAGWERRVTELADGLRNPLQVPPLIVEYRAGVLSVRDGNHRHEAMRRRSWSACWIVIWYNAERDAVAGAERQTS